MRLTTRGRYAVTALLDVALHGPSAVCLSDISSRQNISMSYLEQLFCNLRKVGLVSSVRGPGGGYMLARAPEAITLAEVISAVQEKVDSTSCLGKRNCNGNEPCLAHGLWEELNDCVSRFFASITLADAVCRSGFAASTEMPIRRMDTSHV